METNLQKLHRVAANFSLRLFRRLKPETIFYRILVQGFRDLSSFNPRLKPGRNRHKAWKKRLGLILLLVTGLFFLQGQRQILAADTPVVDIYSETFGERQKRNIVLDDEFTRDYYSDEYKELLAMRYRIAGYARDISNFRHRTEDRSAESIDPHEEILILRALDAANVAGLNIMYLSDTIALFMRAVDQDMIFQDFKKRFEIVISDLAHCQTELNDVISNSANSQYQSKYRRLEDKIREAKELFRKLRAEIEKKHELTTRGKE